ncbi:hypothetical protein T265_01417 [Opisthorchis viverrini]|uniref:Reverse transcriptase domain-containing protein n=1 Tax=Opisthorchis viverrini TaxID=6198 RepID=A0A074ZZN3_OPIVI|nr:hypothetical protein T265_01417 [Opisthorchis viverrini]KER32541.1 hypothetical protein T265_01417 [Opisthorchis viverrini]
MRRGSTYSVPAPVSIGVPQGSVLAPLPFLIYVNDLPDILASPCILFADDLKSWSSNASALQMDVDAAKQWSLDWHLPLNDEKCVHISFRGDSANAFVMHGENEPEKITRIDVKKDLGIWVSSNLSFSLHHEKSAQKAFAILRMIRRTFSRITRMDFQILYGAYVGPLPEYANQVVYSGRTKDVTLIRSVQRAATRMVAGLKSVDYETLNCYEKAREETNALRALVGDKLPSDTEIRFVYRNDSAEVQPEKAKAIRVDRERPAWFPGNLLQRSRDPTPTE